MRPYHLLPAPGLGDSRTEFQGARPGWPLPKCRSKAGHRKNGFLAVRTRRSSCWLLQPITREPRDWAYSRLVARFAECAGEWTLLFPRVRAKHGRQCRSRRAPVRQSDECRVFLLTLAKFFPWFLLRDSSSR